MTNEVAKKETDFSVVLSSRLDSVEDALPKDFNKPRFVQNAIAVLNDNPGLAKFGQQKILAGLMKGAFLGLDFYSKECYLVPFGEKLSFMPDYRGAKKLAKKYSIRPIKDIYAEVVREGDEFSIGVKDNERVVNYTPKPFNDGNIIGAFAVVEYMDGGVGTDQMSIADLENTRKHSKASNSGAWKDFTSEMYRKTVLHRLCKQIELDFESPMQRKYFDEEMEIETDPVESAKNEIAEAEANSEELVVEAEVTPVEAVFE